MASVMICINTQHLALTDGGGSLNLTHLQTEKSHPTTYNTNLAVFRSLDKASVARSFSEQLYFISGFALTISGYCLPTAVSVPYGLLDAFLPLPHSTCKVPYKLADKTVIVFTVIRCDL